MIRPLQPLTTLALAAILVLAGGCADRDPTAAEFREGLKVGEVAQVVAAPTRNSSLRYSSVIGPAGGMLDFGIGSLAFPAGALTQDVTITADLSATTYQVSFSPHGLRFPTYAKPRLRFSLSGIGPALEDMQVIYVNDFGFIEEVFDTSFDPIYSTATAFLQHFSTYAMGAH